MTLSPATSACLKKTETLIRFANNAGGLDNITVALVRFDKEEQE